MSLARLRAEWFPNVRADILAGTVVALALIPEAIAFSIIAGVDPKVGLYASFCIAVVIAFTGGRPGMISAATGAMALVMVTLVKEHGLQYLLAATILAGVLQLVAGALRLGVLMRFVSRSVMTGFVNALAILIFMAQLPELIGVTWMTYAMVAAGLAIIYLFPRITTRGAFAAGGDRGAHDAGHHLRARCANGGRHGRTARRPARLPAARRAASPSRRCASSCPMRRRSRWSACWNR